MAAQPVEDSSGGGDASTGERAATIVCVAAGLDVYICQVCGDCLSSQDYLDTHMKRCHADRPEGRHVCTYCPYSSNHRPNVLTHELTHTGDRPFACRVCKKRFTRRNTLEEHLTVHTRDRPYECTDCGRRFTHPRSLARHRQLHSDEGKPHACRYCGRGFRDRYHLAVHLVVHTGERPFACRVCGQAFSQQGNARDHERRRHPDWRPPPPRDDDGSGQQAASGEQQEVSD